MINIIDKYPIKQFGIISVNGGITLCEKNEGAFLTLRYLEDVENLKKLVDSLVISKRFNEAKHDSIDLKYSVNYTCEFNGE